MLQLNPENKNKKINSIQFLRGIAALWVVIHHIFPEGREPENELIRTITYHGFKGVQIFFVISGFIIPYSLYKSCYKREDFKSFMAKRIVRIEPPYILSIVLILLLNYITTLSPWYNGPAFRIDWTNTLGHIAYLNAFTGWPWINVVYWTLAIEFEFYILMAILYPLLTHRQKKYQAFAFSVLLAFAFVPHHPAHILYHFSFFGMGICLFLYSIQKLSLKEMVILLALFSFEAFMLFDWTYWAVGALTLSSIIFIRKVPKPLLFLGTISYSLYLVHPPIITRVISLSEKFLPQLGRFWSVMLCLIVAIACSYIFYLLVEKPFFKLSKKIDTKDLQNQISIANAETRTSKVQETINLK